jgi:lipoprotein-anchoring transpeptidase ErfK/SrfK
MYNDLHFCVAVGLQTGAASVRCRVLCSMGRLLFFLLASLAAAGLGCARVEKANRLSPSEIAQTWSWTPEMSPSGPVRVEVSLTNQWLVVYRNGIEIGSSPISSGRGTKPTPPGDYRVLEKNVEHRSSLYGNFVNVQGQIVGSGKVGDGAPPGTRFVAASMPYMQRLTWDGVALHQGPLPGYPASSGCIRLPAGFANKLFGVTKIGTPVIVWP